MEIKIAVYEKNSGYYPKVVDDSTIWWHIQHGARIAIVETDFEKLPIPKPAFGVGLILNSKD